MQDCDGYWIVVVIGAITHASMVSSSCDGIPKPGNTSSHSPRKRF
jgi:hypothetical protein